MDVAAHSGNAPHDWSAMLTRFGGSVFHSVEWSAYVSGRDGSTPVHFVWSDPDPIAVATGHLRPIGPAVTKQATLTFLAPPAIVAGRDDLIGDLSGTVREWARRRGGPSLIYVRGKNGTTDLDDDRFDRTHRALEMVATAETDREAVLGRMRPRIRRKVKAAIREGVSVVESSDADGCSKFALLHLESRQRVLERNGAVAPGLAPEDLSDGLLRLVDGGVGRVLLAVHGGDPVAGGFFLVDRNEAFHRWTGSNEAGRTLDAEHVLVADAMTRFAAEGRQRIHLGWAPLGSDDPEHPQRGLYEFKKGMGAEPHVVTSGTLVVRPVSGRGLLAARKLLGTRLFD